MRASKKISNFICMFLTAFLFLCQAPRNVQAHESMLEHESMRTVKVGYYIIPGFQDYDKATDTYSGYGYEYLIALEQYTNWKLEFVPVSFADGVDMLEKGQIDLLNNVSINEERLRYLDYSEKSS